MRNFGLGWGLLQEPAKSEVLPKGVGYFLQLVVLPRKSYSFAVVGIVSTNNPSRNSNTGTKSLSRNRKLRCWRLKSRQGVRYQWLSQNTWCSLKMDYTNKVYHFPRLSLNSELIHYLQRRMPVIPNQKHQWPKFRNMNIMNILLCLLDKVLASSSCPCLLLFKNYIWATK